MTLNTTSIEWALAFTAAHGDGDLFPRLPEIREVSSRATDFAQHFVNHPLTEFAPGVCRRFIVPKDDISYRQATQLDPQDAILFAATIHQFGSQIESRRQPKDRVFSYRFAPSALHGLYDAAPTWNTFWSKAYELSRTSSHVLYCDIADFYNQIAHHTVENQLIASGLPNQAIKWLISLLESTTTGVSRGIPIGPHPAHLVAECSLIPIDNTLSTLNLRYIRYVDDILVFCESDAAARAALGNIATILDKQQRLLPQRHKTKIYSSDEFRSLCTKMIEDRPISGQEADVLAIIRKYTNGDPYRGVFYDQISLADWAALSAGTITKIIADYIAQDPPEYARLRWFYRRLSQIGHPGAIDASLDNLPRLAPCFAAICFYLNSLQSISTQHWQLIGERLLGLLEHDLVKAHEYFRLLILSIFSRNTDINHLAQLLTTFGSADAFARREMILTARINNAADWLRQHKESFAAMDPWQKLAFVHSVALFPRDEKTYFLNRLSLSRPFEAVLAKCSRLA